MLFAPAGTAGSRYVDPRDVAEVAAAALADDGHDGRAYTLTGPEAITFEQIAQDLSRRSGARSTTSNVPDDVAREA